jgi:hypothetical protein
MRGRGRAAADRDAVRSLAGAVEDLRAEQRQTYDELRSTREELRQARCEVAESRGAAMSALELVLDDEASTRRLLRAARAGPGYEDPWQDPAPLVSIVIPTYTNWRLLEQRALPSALAQTHPDIEVVIVGDAAPAETAEAIARVADARVRYENLAVRGPYPDDERQRWFVAGTAPMNRAMELAEGSWIAFLNDDDALRPEHVSTLLEHAREQHAEVAYSKLVQHVPDSDDRQVLGSFPPGDHAFGWQLALQHEALRLFEFELAAALFGEPGDWHRARRMLRAGVRFGQVDRVTCDYYPSQLWTDR